MPWSAAFRRAALVGAVRSHCRAVALSGALLFLLGPRRASAWLFEEHANIGRQSFVANLSSQQQRQLEALWAVVRSVPGPDAKRLCDQPFLPVKHDGPRSCI